MILQLPFLRAGVYHYKLCVCIIDKQKFTSLLDFLKNGALVFPKNRFPNVRKKSGSFILKTFNSSCKCYRVSHWDRTSQSTSFYHWGSYSGGQNRPPDSSCLLLSPSTVLYKINRSRNLFPCGRKLCVREESKSLDSMSKPWLATVIL